MAQGEFALVGLTWLLPAGGPLKETYLIVMVRFTALAGR